MTHLVESADYNERVGVKNVVVRKESAETVNSAGTGSTLQDDDDLKLTLNANEKLQFRAVIIYDGDSTADIKFAFTIPSGASIKWGPSSGVKYGTGGTVEAQELVAAGGSAIEFGATAAGRAAELVGEVICGATAGELQLQWAQVTPDANDTRVLGQSTLSATRWY
jgi:hypothetical protein